MTAIVVRGNRPTQPNMKIIPGIRLVGSLAFILFASGCATTTATTETRESLLGGAGFHSVTASTAQQKKLLAQLPANEISKVQRNREIWFVFPQAGNTALVGTQAQYTAYLQSTAARHVQPVPLHSSLKTPVFTSWGGTTWATNAQATRIPRTQ